MIYQSLSFNLSPFDQLFFIHHPSIYQTPSIIYRPSTHRPLIHRFHQFILHALFYPFVFFFLTSTFHSILSLSNPSFSPFSPFSTYLVLQNILNIKSGVISNHFVISHVINDHLTPWHHLLGNIKREAKRSVSHYRGYWGPSWSNTTESVV